MIQHALFISKIVRKHYRQLVRNGIHVANQQKQVGIALVSTVD